MKTRFIVVAGGVISGVGKGIATASVGRILQEHGYRITLIKIDPYINYDAGTFIFYCYASPSRIQKQTWLAQSAVLWFCTSGGAATSGCCGCCFKKRVTGWLVKPLTHSFFMVSYVRNLTFTSEMLSFIPVCLIL